jgi:hypothetical protein
MAYTDADMDWEPLQSIVGESELGNWMWMHCDVAPASGTVVHFYKNIWSRRYLRIDHDGRAYRELHDGTPVVVPGCGGGTLLALLMLATATFGDGMPPTITLPDAAREPTSDDDLLTLVAVLETCWMRCSGGSMPRTPSEPTGWTARPLGDDLVALGRRRLLGVS